MSSPENRLREPAAPKGFEAGVDNRVLTARQIRLYIENSPRVYPTMVAVGVAGASALLWPYVPEAHPRVLVWDAFVAGTVFMRIAAWSAFSRARPEDDAIRPWLKWFFLPQLLAMLILAASPFVFLPGSSGHDLENILILSLIAYVAIFSASLKLAAYRPLIAAALAPMTLIYIAGLLRLPGLTPKLCALGGVGTGLLAYMLAARFNEAFVRSMALTIRNEQLVAALEARSAQLQEQTLAAERAERDKTRFLAAASHDLRQPMHAISLLVGMLRPRAQAGEREVVERLERSVEAMDNLFNTILDLSKLDAGVVTPAFAAVPLRAIFDSIEVHFAPQAAFKELSLKVFPTRAVVETDRAVLERLLRNLVSNAIKYTREGTVLVGCRRRGDLLRIGVWDTGVGIAPENLERIFEEYFQAGTGPRDRSEGIGLGLSIVRRLARLLGSEIEVRSAAGRGSRFELAVPSAGYTTVDAQDRLDEPAPDTVLAGKYILVVDDEPDVRFGTEALLRQWGAHSASAGSLEEVAALLDQELRFPDAIVTDYRIGNTQTGLDIISAVQRYTAERTPGVIVTGEDLGKAELEANGNVYPVVMKPVAAEELRRRLVAALGEVDALRLEAG
ncbi:MAG TPA: ATP-binding protein [Burkholderiales bacterium]|nr:ATP-binding protein [Burkholderiales bacterium]